MSIGVVIVTYDNSASDLTGVLESIKRNKTEECVIVDNNPASNHGDVRFLANRFNCQYLALPDNPGFATAADHGASQITSTYILFLNPDTQLSGTNLSSAEQYLDNHPDVGVLGLRLMSSKAVVESDSFGEPVTLPTLLSRPWRSVEYPTEPSPVGWVSGGGMIVQRRAYQSVGGFDHQFFMYWEDVDLCLRLQQAGWCVVWYPGISVVHQRGTSLNNSQLKTRLYDNSADKYFRKHYHTSTWLTQRFLRYLYRLYSSRVQ